MSVQSQAGLDQHADGFRGRLLGVFSALVLANLFAWIWTLSAFAGQPVLLGTAILAYSLGVRHALDADHIAAIDNVTRKLIQERKRPVSVGLFFALGHSTVVLIASVAVALAANSLTETFATYRDIGGMIGTAASALFLFVIAIANVAILSGIYRAYRRIRNGERVCDDAINGLLQQRGWLARLFGPLFSMVSQSWQLFPIGFLFALGFDTASEISLFGLSARAFPQVSNWSVLIFPTLFTVAMTLVDTIDGVLMIGAYRWAYRNPVRKLFYNMTVTSISVLVAVIIGTIETLGLIAGHFGLEGWFWRLVSDLGANFGALGYGIVALFAVCWAVSMMIYYVRGYEQHEESR